jgi:pilus assembly protein Flp/PilA
MQFVRKMLKNEKGATAIEYGLIAALIAVAAIGAMTSLGGKLGNTLSKVHVIAKERRRKQFRRLSFASPPKRGQPPSAK